MAICIYLLWERVHKLKLGEVLNQAINSVRSPRFMLERLWSWRILNNIVEILKFHINSSIVLALLMDSSLVYGIVVDIYFSIIKC